VFEDDYLMIALSMIEHYLRHNDPAFHGWHSKAESDGEETLGKCPTCNGKGKIEDNEDESN
jgi:hypothetical protein